MTLKVAVCGINTRVDDGPNDVATDSRKRNLSGVSLNRRNRMGNEAFDLLILPNPEDWRCLKAT